MKKFCVMLVMFLALASASAVAGVPLAWMEDVEIYVVGPADDSPIDPPFACVQMFTEDGKKLAYFALDAQCIETFASDKKLLTGDRKETMGSIGISYTVHGGDEYDFSAPESLVRFAERKLGYREATQRAKTDTLLSARLEAKTTDRLPIASQTVVDTKSLKKLQDIFKDAEYSAEGGCPYTGILTLTYQDGTTEQMYKAIDSCDGIIVASSTPVALGNDGNEQFWMLFDEVKRAIDDL